MRHGHARAGRCTPELKAWYGMIARCYCKTNPKYPRYGGRGIRVCVRWRNNFGAFLKDVGPRPSSAHSIDRKRVNGHYSPRNVRWATPTQQQRNRSNNRMVTFRGRRVCLSVAAERSGLRYGLLKRRLELGWKDTDIFVQPGRNIQWRKK